MEEDKGEGEERTTGPTQTTTMAPGFLLNKEAKVLAHNRAEKQTVKEAWLGRLGPVPHVKAPPVPSAGSRPPTLSRAKTRVGAEKDPKGIYGAQDRQPRGQAVCMIWEPRQLPGRWQDKEGASPLLLGGAHMPRKRVDTRSDLRSQLLGDGTTLYEKSGTTNI